MSTCAGGAHALASAGATTIGQSNQISLREKERVDAHAISQRGAQHRACTLFAP